MPVGFLHVLAVDNGNRVVGYRSPVAERLADDLAAEGETHPLIDSVFPERAIDVGAAMRAVSVAIGRLASKKARSGLADGGGVVPTAVWLDSRKSAGEAR